MILQPGHSLPLDCYQRIIIIKQSNIPGKNTIVVIFHRMLRSSVSLLFSFAHNYISKKAIFVLRLKISNHSLGMLLLSFQIPKSILWIRHKYNKWIIRFGFDLHNTNFIPLYKWLLMMISWPTKRIKRIPFYDTTLHEYSSIPCVFVLIKAHTWQQHGKHRNGTFPIFYTVYLIQNSDM